MTVEKNLRVLNWKMQKKHNTYVYHLPALDDAVKQGSNLKVSDIESESDHESETESTGSDDDDIVLADHYHWIDNILDIQWTTAWTYTNT